MNYGNNQGISNATLLLFIDYSKAFDYVIYKKAGNFMEK